MDHGPHRDYFSPRRAPDGHEPVWDEEGDRLPVWNCNACRQPEYMPQWIGDLALCSGCATAVMEVKHERHSGEYITWADPRKEARRASRDKRKGLSADKRRKIYERDHYRCRYCGGFDRLEIDHVYPVSRGGGNEQENLVTACHECNALKLDRTPEDAGMQLRPVP